MKKEIVSRAMNEYNSPLHVFDGAVFPRSSAESLDLNIYPWL